MAEDRSGSAGGPGAPRRSPSATLMAAGVFVALLLVVIYVGTRLDTLEEQLKYRPPDTQTVKYLDSYGIDIVDGQTVYVPVYSHIYSSGGEAHLLEATLSIRNTDPSQSIRITSVGYFDTGGTLVKEYLGGPQVLGPLESTDYLVREQDTRGGSGANFIVTWDSSEPVYEPIVEAVMVGASRSGGVSFLSTGRALVREAD